MSSDHIAMVLLLLVWIVENYKNSYNVPYKFNV